MPGKKSKSHFLNVEKNLSRLTHFRAVISSCNHHSDFLVSEGERTPGSYVSGILGSLHKGRLRGYLYFGRIKMLKDAAGKPHFDHKR